MRRRHNSRIGEIPGVRRSYRRIQYRRVDAWRPGRVLHVDLRRVDSLSRSVVKGRISPGTLGGVKDSVSLCLPTGEVRNAARIENEPVVLSGEVVAGDVVDTARLPRDACPLLRPSAREGVVIGPPAKN